MKAQEVRRWMAGMPRVLMRAIQIWGSSINMATFPEVGLFCSFLDESSKEEDLVEEKRDGEKKGCEGVEISGKPEGGD